MVADWFRHDFCNETERTGGTIMLKKKEFSDHLIH